MVTEQQANLCNWCYVICRKEQKASKHMDLPVVAAVNLVSPCKGRGWGP
jgi:hypothetical protein